MKAIRAILFLTGALVAGLPATGRADDAAPARLTLDQAHDLAIKNHPRITQADLLALASRQVIREARSPFFPTVTANATAAGVTGANTRIAAGALNNPLILDREADGVIINQLITDFGRTANLAGSAKSQALAAEQNALATRAQVLLAVDSAFFDALKAQTVLAVARQTVAARQSTFDLVDQKRKAQIVPELDASFARVDLQQGQLLLLTASNDLQAAFATLANVLGGRDMPEYTLTEDSAPLMTPPDDTQVVQTALKERPDLAQLRYQLDSANRFAQAENDLSRPTLSAVGTAGVIPVHDPELKDNFAAAGVNLSVPIFEGQLFTARRQEAGLRSKAAGEALRDAENNVIRDARIASLNLKLAAQRLDLTRQLLTSANEALDLAQGRYKAGSSTIVELNQALLSQTQAQIDEASARYDYHARGSILLYQMGQLK